MSTLRRHLRLRGVPASGESNPRRPQSPDVHPHLDPPRQSGAHGRVRAPRCHGDLPTAAAGSGAVATGFSILARQALLLAGAPHALRWRLETFGLYMPSLPEARPWWRPSARALRALLGQLPGYARWLAEMQALRHGGARGWWRYRTGTDVRDWEEWLALARQETDE